MRNEERAIVGLVVWRLCLAWIVRTAFDPDEYWQGPEVAHRLVFGYAASGNSFAASSSVLNRTGSPIPARSDAKHANTRFACRYGYLSWEWAAGLRSYAHPILFTPLYALLKWASFDTPALVQFAPRVTQAAIALLHDYALAAFVRQHLPWRLQSPARAVATLSWFNNFTHTRPYSNSLESTLHLLCLTFWPPPTPQPAATSMGYATRRGIQGRRLWSRRGRRAAALCCAGLCCVIRPTSAALFVPLAVCELLWPLRGSALRHVWPPYADAGGSVLPDAFVVTHALVFVIDAVSLAAAFLLAFAAVDRCFHGRWLLPAWENVRFNVLQNGSAAFGEHESHWYVSQGLPAMLASLLPLVIAGLYAAAVRRRSRATAASESAQGHQREGEGLEQTPVAAPLWPAALAAWGVAVHSCVPHKEFRFVLPSFELLLLYAAQPTAWACSHLGVTSPLQPAHDKRKASSREVPRDRQSGEIVGTSGPLTRNTVKRRQRSSTAHSEVSDSEGCAQARARDAVLHAAAHSSGQLRRSGWAHTLLAAIVMMLVALQLPMLAYFALVHQRGAVATAEWLSHADLPSVRRFTLRSGMLGLCVVCVIFQHGCPTRLLLTRLLCNAKFVHLTNAVVEQIVALAG